MRRLVQVFAGRFLAQLRLPSHGAGSKATIEDNPNWRRHRGACPNYRERWSSRDEAGDDGCTLLYQIVCLMDTPPITAEEQALCMGSTRGCWRLKKSTTRSRSGAAAVAAD